MRTPDLMDVHVGSRLRLRRMIIGLSQEKLGDQMGLTFQQIQKYEKGHNRIGAGRLFKIAKILDVPVQFFFEDASPSTGAYAGGPGLGETRTEAFLLEFLNSRDGLYLNRAFLKIADQKVRKRLVSLVRSMAGDEEVSPAA